MLKSLILLFVHLISLCCPVLFQTRPINSLNHTSYCERSEPPSLSNCPRCLYIYIYLSYERHSVNAHHSQIANIIFNFTDVLSLTCNNTACGGIREHNAVAFTSNCERSEPPSLSNCPHCLYIYIYNYRTNVIP